MNEFIVAIAKSDFENTEEEAWDEFIKNSNDELIFKCRALKGTWISSIAKKINEYENKNFSMIGKNGRINCNKKVIMLYWDVFLIIIAAIYYVITAHSYMYGIREYSKRTLLVIHSLFSFSWWQFYVHTSVKSIFQNSRFQQFLFYSLEL